MAIVCENLGPAGAGAPRSTCENYVLCILTTQGEPPAGSYFWHPKRERGFGVSFCYDDASPVHGSNF
jgi:hypothetical protein